MIEVHKYINLGVLSCIYIINIFGPLPIPAMLQLRKRGHQYLYLTIHTHAQFNTFTLQVYLRALCWDPQMATTRCDKKSYYNFSTKETMRNFFVTAACF